MTKREPLLNEFLGEEVIIMTDMITAVETPSGELAEIPLVIEGILTDYDEEFVLISATGTTIPELIRKTKIVNLRISDNIQQVMDDPGRPPKDGMN
jgi:hypothetical protein